MKKKQSVWPGVQNILFGPEVYFLRILISNEKYKILGRVAINRLDLFCLILELNTIIKKSQKHPKRSAIVRPGRWYV